MFSGIIQYLGKLQKKEDNLFTFKASSSQCLRLDTGVSVAVNGVCLTVITKTADTFSVEVMPETLKKTTLGNLQPGALVNLELPVTPQTFLSGHFIQGHIDGKGKVVSLTKDRNSRIITISYPQMLGKYIAAKGSIAINGVSLTVIEVEKDFFTVGIIPYTWKNTMFHTLKKGDLVNIEVDILAKYVKNRHS